jgi:hypothetical protein
MFNNYSLAVLTPNIEDKPLNYHGVNKGLKDKNKNIILSPHKGLINKASLTNPVFKQEISIEN